MVVQITVCRRNQSIGETIQRQSQLYMQAFVINHRHLVPTDDKQATELFVFKMATNHAALSYACCKTSKRRMM